MISVENLTGRLRYNDCDDVLRIGSNRQSDSYTVFLNSSEPLEGTDRCLAFYRVYCDYETGETRASIMQQKYGRVSFRRKWHEYEYGFGDRAGGDFWAGLRRIKNLTDAGYMILTVTLQDCDNVIKTIRYNDFRLGEADESYPLHIGGYVSSAVLADDFSYNNGMPFATTDRPDRHNCANHQGGGWWYNYCTYTLPTGHYYNDCYYTPSGTAYYNGIYYSDWLGFEYSLKYIKMELLRKSIK